MNVTQQLKGWLISNVELAKDASDDDAIKAASSAIANGTLSAEKYAELTTESDPKAILADLIKGQVDASLKPLTDQIAMLTKSLTEDGKAEAEAPEVSKETIEAIIKQAQANAKKKVSVEEDEDEVENLPAKLFGAASEARGNGTVRVKSVTELFDNSRKAVIVPEFKANGRRNIGPNVGRPAIIDGRELDEPSQFDKHLMGAWWRFRLSRQAANPNLLPPALRMGEIDRRLMEHAIHEEPWVGRMAAIGESPVLLTQDAVAADHVNGKLTELGRKAILDDSTSEGDELVLEVLDRDLIRTPILFGELLPLVDVTNVTTTRMQIVQMSNITIESGPAEGTADTLQSTANFFTPINVTLFVAMGSIEVGLDWMADSGADVAMQLNQSIADGTGEWIDNQIANGDGTTEPQGIFVASGTTAINTSNGTSGPFVTGDVETAIFALNKATRVARGGRGAFISNDTTYRQVRSVAIGSGDQRRIFGMNYSSYAIGEFPYAVQDNIADNNFAFGNMAYYKCYRRAGLQIRTTSEGQTLGLRNTMLIIARSRWGGAVSLGSAFAISTDAPIVG